MQLTEITQALEPIAELMLDKGLSLAESKHTLELVLVQKAVKRAQKIKAEEMKPGPFGPITVASGILRCSKTYLNRLYRGGPAGHRGKVVPEEKK